MDRKWYSLAESENGEAEISLYDEIGAYGVGAKQFLADLGKLKGKHVHLRINSPGGSVVDGTAIFNALRRHEGGVTVHIDALAASMASVIAMAGMPTLMADNALLMVHNPWTISMGDSDDLRKEADLLDKLKDSIRSAYKRKTDLSDAELQDMMDAETWLDSVDAVALGFVDAIEEGIEAAASITPEIARARFDTLRKNMTAQAEPEVTVPEIVEAPVVETPEAAPEVVEEVPVEINTEEGAEVPAAEPVSEPVAKLDPSALLAKVNDLVALNNVLRTRAEVAEQTLSDLERSLGVASAQVEVPSTEPAQPQGSLLDRFNAIQDPAERTAFYKRHAAELGKLI